jgi:tetrapyrrole methylase family protein / MazG family protein
MTARIVVVGLGPGGAEHVTLETLAAIDRVPVRYLRTAVHPSATIVSAHDRHGASTFDHLYDDAESFDDVYERIADGLVAAALEHGEVLYAVPGSPLVLERSVRHLRERATGPNAAIGADFELVVHPAMSFLDVAYARLGIDPVECGVRLVDGHQFAIAAAGERGPLLVAHTHANWVLSNIKLAVDGASGDEPVTILHALGTPDEQIITTVWAELDRTIDADHLTSIWIPELATPVGAEYVRFHQLARTLREQCPWDIEQTHRSLVPHLLEETYEVVDAVLSLDPDDPTTDDDLIEELGDLLYQVEFHATIAEQEGRFTIADVASGIHDKLVRRHPHVFGSVDINSDDRSAVDTVLANWDEIKRTEKSRTSVFDGIPRSMPSLSYAGRVGSKASKVGFDWPDVEGAFPKVAEETAELRATIDDGDPVAQADELGDLLFAIVNVARHLGVDAELALRAATDKFRARFESVEVLAADRGIDLHRADLATLDALWVDVKIASAASPSTSDPSAVSPASRLRPS